MWLIAGQRLMSGDLYFHEGKVRESMPACVPNAPARRKESREKGFGREKTK